MVVVVVVVVVVVERRRRRRRRRKKKKKMMMMKMFTGSQKQYGDRGNMSLAFGMTAITNEPLKLLL